MKSKSRNINRRLISAKSGDNSINAECPFVDYDAALDEAEARLKNQYAELRAALINFFQHTLAFYRNVAKPAILAQNNKMTVVPKELALAHFQSLLLPLSANSKTVAALAEQLYEVACSDPNDQDEEAMEAMDVIDIVDSLALKYYD